MSKREKWVVFPEGNAGLNRIILDDGRSGFILIVSEDDIGSETGKTAQKMGFHALPDVKNAFHYVPQVGKGVPFSLSELATNLGGEVSTLSGDEMSARTIGEDKRTAKVVATGVSPIKPERVGVNVMGEPVYRAENGRFVSMKMDDGEVFVQEPASGSLARFLRAPEFADIAPISGALYRGADVGFDAYRIEQMIGLAMEPRDGQPAPSYTKDEARDFIRKDLIKQLMDSAVFNDASRGSWHDTSRVATAMTTALSRDTVAGENLSPSLHLMMLVKRLSRKFSAVDFMGGEDLALALPGRYEEESDLSVLDLSTLPAGQRLSYVINRMTRRKEKGRTMIFVPSDAETAEVSSIRSELGANYGVESVVEMPHNVVDGTAGYQKWTLMVFGDRRPEPLDALPIAALRTMKATTVDDLLSVEREINRSTERLREFNSDEEITQQNGDDELAANDHQVPYMSMSKVSPPETMIPYALQGAVANAQAKVMRHMEDRGGVDSVVADALGMTISDMGDIMSSEQVDSVAFWLYSRDKEMKGFACLDGTGVGKTRSNLGIARAFLNLDPHEEKKRKVFYLTENNLNAPDIVKELHQMGMGDLRVGVLTSPFKSKITVNGKTYPVEALKKKEKDQVFESLEFPEEFDIIVSTFSTFNSTAADNLASTWAHNAFGEHVMVIADEAHNAINAKTNTGRNIRAMRQNIPDNNFLSSTATPFKTPEEVAAYDYLLPASAGDTEEIMAAVIAGKEAAQEVFTTMLAGDGSIIRRTRSLNSVNFRAHLPTDTQLLYNQRVMSSFAEMSSLMMEESTAINEAVRILKNEEMGRFAQANGQDAMDEIYINVLNNNFRGTTKFGPSLTRLTNMIMVGLRIEGIYPQIVADLENGMKPVISFEHTMMNLFDEAGEEEDLSEMTMRDQIRRVQDRIYKVKINGQDVDIREINPQIQASAQRISDIIDQFPELPASPLDWLMDRLGERGVTCGELSGRSTRYSHGRIVKRTKDDKDKRAVVDKFNDGQIDVLFHNKTGATGVSFHAHKDFRDQRPRATYIVAAFSEVIKMLQGFGRTDRKEQTSNPTINWVMTGLIGETRSFQQINRRLRMLGASVDANRDHPMLVANVPDLLNKVGDRAFLNVLRNRPDLAQRMDVGSYLQANNADAMADDRENAISATSIMDLANICMSRMIMLRDEEQSQLMDSVMFEFDALIEELDARNANPLKPKQVDGEIQITSTVLYQGDEPEENDYDRSAFLEPLYLDTGIQRIEGRSKSGDEIVALVERCRRLQGAEGLETWANIVRTAMPNFLRRFLPEEMNYEQAIANPAGAGPQFQKRFEVLDRMSRTLDNIKPGVTVRMPMIDDLWDVPSSYVITDIVPPPNALEAGNPAAYRIRMYAPGEITERSVTLKRIMDLNEEEVVFHIGLSRGHNKDLHKSFDDANAEVYERPVQVLRGNLLKASVLSRNHNLGTTCLYRNAETKQMEKGIVITDRKLDLKRLPVDIRDGEIAKIMLDRRRDGVAETDLLKLVASPSNQKNDYNVKDAQFYIAGTQQHLVVSYMLNRGMYAFFEERPGLHEALTRRPLPALNTVRSSRVPRVERIRYDQEGANERISTIIRAMFARHDNDNSLNLNFFVSGILRDEVNELVTARTNPFANPKGEVEDAVVVDVVAPKDDTSHKVDVSQDENVKQIESDGEDFSWDT